MIYNINYAGGSMTLDVVPFIEKHNITDAKYLARKVIGIAFDAPQLAADIIADVDQHRQEERRKPKSEQDARTLKKYDRFIESLESIAIPW